MPRSLALSPLALLLALAGAAHAQAPAEPGWARGRPSIDLASSYFGRAQDGISRRVFSQALRFETRRAPSGFSYEVTGGWVRLVDAGEDGGSLATSAPGNIGLGAKYHFLRAESHDLAAGLLVAIGATRTEPTPYRRTSRSAYGHRIAMDGVWDAWLWSPERGAIVLPARFEADQALGGWHGRLALDGALVLSLPDSEAGESTLGRLVQVGAGYAVWPWPWFEAAARARFVWMPTAAVFRAQSSLAPSLAVVLGRWRLGAELLVNLDEPFGWLGQGQRIWAASLAVGVWL